MAAQPRRYGVPTMTVQQRHLFTRRWRNVVAQQSEASFHIQLVAMLHWCLRPDVIMRHVPNGEHRDPRTAAKLKAMGVLPGCADLEFHWCEVDALKRKVRRILHLELKRRGGMPNEAQLGYALAVRVMGDEYHVVRSVDEAITILGERGLIRSDVEVSGRRW